MNGEIVLRPLLSRHPDARRGAWPLLDPFLLPYLAIMFGSIVAALAGTYNALVLRRGWLAVRSLAAGAAGWIGFFGAVTALRMAGVENGSLLLIGGRIVHFAVGGVLTFLHQPHFRGHAFLRGRAADVIRSYAVAMLVYFVTPGPVVLLLQGVWLV